MIDPLVIEPCSQKDIADCGVAALAMLTGKGYAAVMDTIPKRWKVGSDGMSRRQMTTTAKRLACPIRFIKDGDLAGVVGILDLQRYAEESNPAAGYEGHWAVVAKGVVINPADGMVWTDIDAFFKTRRWMPLGVYVRKQEDSEHRE